MKPPKPRTASRLALTLCMVAVALWLRSYWIRDVLVITPGMHQAWCESSAGDLGIVLLHREDGGKFFEKHLIEYQHPSDISGSVADRGGLPNTWELFGRPAGPDIPT